MANGQVPVIELRGISKRYAGVRALDDVHFDLRPGEVHGILGENGAGKSTMIRIMGGATRPDEGTILIDGQPVEFHRPSDAQHSGVCVIFQELEVHPALSVTENVMLGRLPTSRGGLVDWASAERQTKAVLASMGLNIPPRMKVEKLGLAERRLLAIGRALAVQARVLIMDEPTAALTETESVRLGELILRMRAAGTSVVYVSHRVSEVLALADRVTVMRDGKRVETVAAANTSTDALVRAMVGRDVVELYPRRRVPEGPVVLELQDLGGDGFRSVDLTVRAGEVVALYGLLGAGCTNVSRAIVGAPAAQEGSILINGKRTRLRRPTDARRQGVALLPSERRREGLVLPSDVMLNTVLASLPRYSRSGVFRERKARDATQSWAARLSIRMPSNAARVDTLSGGNQQKVVFARWLDAASRILILEEPTRGVDVGAKAEIHGLIDELCQNGVAILLVSSEIPEVLALSDRIVVMSRGRITRELAHPEATKELLMSHAAA